MLKYIMDIYQILNIIWGLGIGDWGLGIGEVNYSKIDVDSLL